MKNDNKNLILRDLQLTILEILKEIKRVCEKYDIDYFLAGGTLLGAVRHKGFIPWDDDADIGMVRSEYNKFIKVCLNGALSSKFILQSYETDSAYCDEFIRIRMNDTLCVIPYHRSRGYHHLGVFVDIFPYDKSNTNDVKKIDKLRHKISVINKFIQIKTTKFELMKTKKAKFIKILILFVPTRLFLKCRGNMENRFNKTDTHYYVDLCSCYETKRAIFDKNIIEELIDLEFETLSFKGLKNYDSFLKTVYGDYMVLPPLEKRIAHCPNEIKL